MPFFTRKSQWTAASEGQWKGPASTGVSLVYVLDELELSNQANIDGQGCFHWPCCSWNKSMPSSLFIRRTSVRGGCRVECPLATVKTYQWSTVSYRPRDAILELWRLQKLRLVLLESWGSFRLRENKTQKCRSYFSTEFKHISMPTEKCSSHVSPKKLLYEDRDHYKEP